MVSFRVYLASVLAMGIGMMVMMTWLHANIIDWETIHGWEAKATLYDQTLMTIEGEQLPWCVAEDRGDIEPEHRLTSAIVLVNWEDEHVEDGYYGEAVWDVYEDNDMAACTITIPQPKKVWGDIDMDTVGHEFLHCVLGDYHRE